MQAPQRPRQLSHDDQVALSLDRLVQTLTDDQWRELASQRSTIRFQSLNAEQQKLALALFGGGAGTSVNGVPVSEHPDSRLELQFRTWVFLYWPGGRSQVLLQASSAEPKGASRPAEKRQLDLSGVPSTDGRPIEEVRRIMGTVTSRLPASMSPSAVPYLGVWHRWSALTPSQRTEVLHMATRAIRTNDQSARFSADRPEELEGAAVRTGFDVQIKLELRGSGNGTAISLVR